jgi:hypothetical protein
MAHAIYSFKVDSDGEIRVGHIFFGKTEEEAEDNLKKHAEACPKFGPAYRNDQTIDIGVELEALPAPDVSDLEEFIGLAEEEEEEYEYEDEEE